MFHLFPLENSVRSRKENSLFISIIIFSLEGEELFLMCWFQIKVFCLTLLSQVLLSQRNLNPLGIHLKFSLPMACNHTARTCLARLQTDFMSIIYNWGTVIGLKFSVGPGWSCCTVTVLALEACISSNELWHINHLHALLAYNSWQYCWTLLYRWPTRQLDSGINRMSLPYWISYNKVVCRSFSPGPSSTASSGSQISRSCTHQWACQWTC